MNEEPTLMLLEFPESVSAGSAEGARKLFKQRFVVDASLSFSHGPWPAQCRHCDKLFARRSKGEMSVSKCPHCGGLN